MLFSNLLTSARAVNPSDPDTALTAVNPISILYIIGVGVGGGGYLRPSYSTLNTKLPEPTYVIIYSWSPMFRII